MNGSIGKLLWISIYTKPVVAFDVCQLGTIFKNSGKHDIKCINIVIAYLKQDPVCSKY